MKKLFSSLLCFAFAVGAFAQANIQMRVVPTFIEPGTDEVEIEFELINPDQQVSAGNMNIVLPEGIAAMTEGEDCVIEMNSSRLPKTGKHTITGKCQSDGSINILFYSGSNNFITKTEGTLFTLTCNVSSSVPTGLLPVTLKDINLSWGVGSTDCYDQAIATGYVRVKGTETANLTIPEGGYATLCLPFAATLKDGMKAYEATGVSGSAVTLSELSSIPAMTPVIVTGAAGTYTFTGDNSGATTNECTSGVLKGFLAETVISSGYVLQKQSGVLGFYKLDKAKSIPAYRCALSPTAPAGSSVPCYSIGSGEDGTTGLDSLTAEPVSDRIYTLDGKETNSLKKGGMYVINGTKVIIK